MADSLPKKKMNKYLEHPFRDDLPHVRLELGLNAVKVG